MKALWAFWREYGAMIGERQTTIWLWLVYFLVVGPSWAAARLTGQRLLPDDASSDRHWLERRPGPRSVAEMRRMG
jgi:hypothetical protein